MYLPAALNLQLRLGHPRNDTVSHQISSLDINEVSLVDSPANAGPEIDPRTGRPIKRAVVALFKGDSDTNEFRKGKKMKFAEILKSARTRDEIVAAVEGQAQVIAKREGISRDAGLVLAWGLHPEACEAY